MSFKDIQAQIQGYESEDYAERLSRPICQWHNDKKDGGLLITDQNAEACGFAVDYALEHGWTKVYPSWESVQFALSNPKPAMAVLRRGGLKIFDRESGKYIGGFSADVYNREIHVVKTRFAVALLARVEDAYQFLHTEPLMLTVKGSIGNAFGGRNGVYTEHKKAIAKHLSSSAPPWAFALHMQCKWEEVGSGRNTSYVQMPYGYPGLLNNKDGILEKCYVGQDLLSRLQGMYAETEDFDASGDRQQSEPDTEAIAASAKPAPADDYPDDIPF